MTCYFCQSKNISQLLDLGQQPISNRFLGSKSESEKTFPLVMNQCQDCGLVQVNAPVSADELKPSYDWITYNEPEGHLDRLAEIIRHLPGISSASKVCGITFKDDSTLMRLEKLGLTETRRLSLEDLEIDEKGVGAETIQARLTPQIASKIIQKFGAFDVIIVRHIFEHVHHPADFIEALKNLTADEGYIVFEVPDCSRALENCDYTTIWEEHTLYFTPQTFQSSLKIVGFQLERYESYPYPFENSLVGIVRVSSQQTQLSRPSKEILEPELVRAKQFANRLLLMASALQKYLKEYRQNHGKIAFFGAGHLACTFVSVLGLKDHIDFFVDDNPHKRGLFMPGCRLPIYESASLRRENVKLCLLSLNPLSEEKVLKANENWDGKFLSIFPSSPIALKLPLEDKVTHAAQRI